MHLQKQAIEEFKRIYWLEYGIKLSENEARILAHTFYKMMDEIFNSKIRFFKDKD